MSHSSLVVVTGGAGFIGSHVVDALLVGGHRVVVVDDFSSGKRANLAQHAADVQLEIVERDVADDLAPALAPFGPVERIVHLAAQVSVVRSIEDPTFDMRVNYGGTLSVLEFARTHNVRKVVLASSAAVYGDVADMPIDEASPTRPVSPYGIHKLASEHALAYYAAVHGVPSTALRFFNVYGPRQDPTSPYSGVISIFSDRAKRGCPLTIFGGGEQTRDFVYVGDVVRAVIAALGDTTDLGVANVGTGIEIRVADLARVIVELYGGHSVVEHAPARPGEVFRSCARVDRLSDRLGVVASTSLVDGLRATWAYRPP